MFLMHANPPIWCWNFVYAENFQERNWELIKQEIMWPMIRTGRWIGEWFLPGIFQENIRTKRLTPQPHLTVSDDVNVSLKNET